MLKGLRAEDCIGCVWAAYGLRADCSWTAQAVQRGCGCVIGTDYPRPIVDHKHISKVNMQRMKEAYDAHKAGPAHKPGIRDAKPAKRKAGTAPAGPPTQTAKR